MIAYCFSAAYDQGVSQSKTSVFACIGDSLTRGRVSANYLNLLEEIKPHTKFLNYGEDGALVADALKRSSEFLEQQPEGVIVMLGTNDVRYTFSKAKAKRQTQKEASADNFKENIEKLVRVFKETTGVKIIVVGIPLLDESFKSGVEPLVEVFNNILRDICLKHKITFVDVHTPMRLDLKNSTFIPPRGYADVKASVYLALVLKKVFRLTWNQISDLRKSYYHTDFAHLNDRAAKIIAAEIAALC